LTIALIEVAAVVDEQSVERIDPHVGEGRHHLAQNLHALLDAEQSLLRVVDEDGHDHLVGQHRGPREDIEVAVGDGVERTWADRCPHEGPL
jgi:hypothetical protein